MDRRPFHHGNLPAALIAQAERTLRDHGLEAVTLRDLARQVGVSHGAPRRHFPNRDALLDAVAESGFGRLNEQIASAIEGAGADYVEQFHAAATAYAGFATGDAALLELMFARFRATSAEGLRDAAAQFFGIVGNLIVRGQQSGRFVAGDPERLRLLLSATMHGIASFAATGRIPAPTMAHLVDDAVGLFTGHPAASRPPQRSRSRHSPTRT